MLHINLARRLRFFIPVLAILTLVGCQATESFYRGFTADAKNVITLTKSGPVKGNWKTFDVDLDYSYTYSGSVLDLSGFIYLSDFYQINTNRINSLDIYFFFLDSNSKVLETTLLTQSLSLETDQKLTFSHTLQVPAGAVAFAFGYKGTATIDGEGKRRDVLLGTGGLELFYELPKKNPKQ